MSSTFLPENWEYTKIVATIGPATDSPEILEKLLKAGMNVARLNTKHGTTEWHAERIDRIRAAAHKVKKPVAVLLDLQGPEIRINLPEKKSFELAEGEKLTFRSVFAKNEAKQVQIPQMVIDALSTGDLISTDDGFCEYEVIEKKDDYLIAQALNGFTVKDRKTLNTPGVVIDMPSLTPDDLEKLDAAIEHPVDFVGLSFVRDKNDIDALKIELGKRDITAKIIAKIENQAAIDNLDELIKASDAIMVARGDLAVEIPMEQLTYWQKEIIRRCRAVGRPVITATQMLKSMVENPRPTRAEVSDVANAVFDCSDAIMLSEETTIGNYPVKTVATMRRIARYNEPHAKPTNTLTIEPGSLSRTMAVTRMATSLIEDHIESIDKIVVLTETGYTAQQLSRLRPHVPIIVLSDQANTVNHQTLVYSTYPVLMDFPEGRIESIEEILKKLQAVELLKTGERILVIHGTVYKRPGQTNTVTIIDVQ